MLISWRETRRPAPDFFLIGAPHSGTTSLYNYLRQHPDVYIPMKEPQFFSQGGAAPTFDPRYASSYGIWKPERYMALYRNAPAHVLIGDCSASYLGYAEVAIPMIRRMYGERWRELRIMVILRNPVDAVCSQYRHNVKLGLENLPLSAAMAQEEKRGACIHPLLYYVGGKNYAETVAAYRRAFPHMRVYWFDDLVRDARGMARDMYRFLGLRDVENESLIDIRSNRGGRPRNRFLFSRAYPTGRMAVSAVLRLGTKESRRRRMLARLDEAFERMMLRPVDIPTDVTAGLRDRFERTIRGLERDFDRDLSCWRCGDV